MMRAECLVRTSLPDHPWPVVIRPETMETDRNNDSGISPGRTSSETNSNSPNFTLNSPHSPDRRAATPNESPNGTHELKIDTNHYQKSNELYSYTAVYSSFGKNRSYSPPIYSNYSRSSCQDDTPKKLVIDEQNFSPNSDLNNSKNDKMDMMSEKSNDYDCDKDYMNDSNEPAEDSLERLKNALERSTALSGIFKSRMDDNDAQTDAENSQDSAKKEFSCPLCAYRTPYRHRYQQHLGDHYSDKCTLCDFTGQSAADLEAHLKDIHNITDIHDLSDLQGNNSDYLDDDDAPGSKRGKSKTFKCKQCNYVTKTKLDFWEHRRFHIKPEKLLECPHCPFVTDLKHHIEFHLDNHKGLKKFKCSKCVYSCVNKSMLNSHLKSHSNVYQYRCSDCAYATKYCHSLKLHLKKYQHKPAVVLNADGSPNPLSIIDIYGTRRGPKQKSNKIGSEDSEDKNLYLDIKVPAKDKSALNLPGGIVVPNAPQISPKSPIYHLNNNDIKQETHNGVTPKFFYCSLCEFRTISPDILNQHMYLHVAETNLAHMFKTNNNLQEQTIMKEYFQSAFMNPNVDQPPFIDTQPSSPLSLVSPKMSSPVAKRPASPLDLSKQDNESENEGNLEKKPKINEETKKEQSTTKHRRKGKAYKLERINERFDSSPDEEIYATKVDEEKIKVPEFKPKSPREEDEGEKLKDVGKVAEDNEQVNSHKESYHCEYCDMTFGDDVLHTMHMRYHGYKDPFTCNSCGQYTPDKFSFFLHIARSSHS